MRSESVSIAPRASARSAAARRISTGRPAESIMARSMAGDAEAAASAGRAILAALNAARCSGVALGKRSTLAGGVPPMASAAAMKA